MDKDTKQTTSQTTNQPANKAKIHQVGSQNPSKIYQVGAKIHQDGCQNLPKSFPSPLGGVLGRSWGQEGPKSQKLSKTATLGTPKSNWHQLGSQNPPKMEPTGLQKPSKRQTSEIRKTLKNHLFLNLFGGFGVPSWTKNPPKISPRGHQKQDEILNGFRMALG